MNKKTHEQPQLPIEVGDLAPHIIERRDILEVAESSTASLLAKLAIAREDLAKNLTPQLTLDEQY